MAKSKGSHKKQHFVPQCYMRAWHDPSAPKGPNQNPYVWVFNRDGSGARPKSPANLFTESDIYTIVHPDGQRDLRLEHAFQTLEDKFTRIRNLKFNRLLEPSSEDLAWIVAFVAAAHARTAVYRNFHRDQWGGILKRMEEFEAAYKAASPRQQEQIVRMSTLSQGPDRGLGIEEIRQLQAQPIQQLIGPTLATIAPMLGRMNIAVLCTDEPLGFVTSDHPCTWFDPEGYKRQPIYRSPALGSRTIEVTLPISPKQCLFISHDQACQGYIQITPNVVQELNRRHIGHCDKTFIAHSQSTHPSWFEERPMPEDAWEKVRERKIASGEWPAPLDNEVHESPDEP